MKTRTTQASRRPGALPLVLFTSLGLLWGASATAQTRIEAVSVTIGAMEIVDVPFTIEGYQIANPSIAQADQLGDRKLRIMGLAPGNTDLLVTGTGGATIKFALTSVENIRAVLTAMKKDLDSVPEVELTVNLGRLIIKGEVSSIRNWELLQKVVDVYGSRVVNLAVFRPTPEVMMGLKSSLEKSGFQVVREETPEAPGILSVRFTGNSIFVNGSVYSAKDVARVRSVVKMQDWLNIVGESDDKPQEKVGKINAMINLSIIPTLIELETVFVGVSDEQYKQIGANLFKAGLVTIDATSAAIQGTIGKDNHGAAGGSYSINAGLQGALKFFAGSGPGRFNTGGHMTFRNDSPEWRTYQSGGTLKIKVATSEQIGVEDIDYGLIMRARGGLLDAETARLDLNLELSYPVPIGKDYDLKRNRIETSIDCKLNQTLVLGGMRSLIEQSSNEGIPFLRSVPVLQYFFSEKNTLKQDSKVLILLSPRIAGSARPTVPVSETTKETLQDAEKPAKQLEKESKGRRFFFF